MKTVYLIRHAKSDWSYEELPDIDRCLNRRGYNDAHRMGRALLDKKMIPQQFISSPAIRAVSTALILMREMGKDESELVLQPQLYEMGFRKYIDTICSAQNSMKSIAITGHNPLITEAAHYLTGKQIDFPTCAVVVIEFDVDDWMEVSADSGTIKQLFYPKE